MEFVFKTFDKLTQREVYEILKSRAQIFVVEQGMNCLDPDGDDINAIHIFLKEGDVVIAYLRAFPVLGDVTTFKIGRVLTLNHKKGYGKLLMNEAIKQLKSRCGCKKITLHSQKAAVGFYEKLGFSVNSDEFFEEGIPHLSMELTLQ